MWTGVEILFAIIWTWNWHLVNTISKMPPTSSFRNLQVKTEWYNNIYVKSKAEDG